MRLIVMLCALLILPDLLMATEAEITAPAHEGWLSIVPPLLAIILAIAFRQVVPALFIGILAGAWFVEGITFDGLIDGFLNVSATYVKAAVADESHASIIIFSMMIGGMVGIISRNGGMHGIVNAIIGLASSARRACVATATMGMMIFFDDYANSLVVGNSMRPITDKLRVSREKLAYLVDSTAAPVSCIALVTTWIGFEIDQLSTEFTKAGVDLEAYDVFLRSIPYSFYPILALVFVYMIALTGKDFGPMLKAEQKARRDGIDVRPEAQKIQHHDVITPIEDKPQRAINAVLPVVAMVATVMYGLYETGHDAEHTAFADIIGNSDSYTALLWGSLVGVITAAFLSMSQGILSMAETVDAWFNGLKSMLQAILILVLAWSLANVTDALGTGIYLSEVLEGQISPALFPALTFVLAAITAFSTGSSWTTMGILYPLVIPVVLVLTGTNADYINTDQLHIVYSSVAAVLGGAVWGDHCSPISDTTILSSMASGCDHVSHVRTQLPYALFVATIALFVTILPTGYGIPWWTMLPIAIVILFAVLHLTGQSADETSAQ